MTKKLNLGGEEILDIESLATLAGMNTAISQALSGVFTIVPNVAAIKEPGKIYLIKMAAAEGADNAYDEYLYIDGKAEHIGSTELDLSGYAKTVDMTAAIATAKTSAINTAATDAQTKADAAKAAAISAAATDAQTKADAAKSAAISAAATDAQTKANTAKTDAISAAASDATTKANNAKTAAVAESKAYADGAFAKVVKLTQAEYTALATKDARTFYLIS